jgi:hypothetical protein
MIRRIPPLLCFLFLALHAWAQPMTEFEFGPRPVSPVFDPAGLFPPEVTKELSENLTQIHQKEGIDVMIIVDSNFDKAPPEIIAQRFASAWSDSIAHCVILHVPGREGAPWIFPGGALFKMMNPAAVKKAVEDAKRRAAAEPIEVNQVRVAATEAADLLRFWLGSAIERSEKARAEQNRLLELHNARERKKKFLIIGAAGIAVSLALGISYLFYIYRKQKPQFFPNRSWQPRLGAPYAGGNYIIAKIGRSSPPSQNS